MARLGHVCETSSASRQGAHTDTGQVCVLPSRLSCYCRLPLTAVCLFLLQ